MEALDTANRALSSIRQLRQEIGQIEQIGFFGVELCGQYRKVFDELETYLKTYTIPEVNKTFEAAPWRQK